MKISNRKFLSILIVMAMLCTTFLGGSVQAADTGSTTVFDKNGLKADFKVDSQWTGFFNGTITVTNTGTQPVEDWALTFDSFLLQQVEKPKTLKHPSSRS